MATDIESTITAPMTCPKCGGLFEVSAHLSAGIPDPDRKLVHYLISDVEIPHECTPMPHISRVDPSTVVWDDAPDMSEPSAVPIPDQRA